MILRVLLLLILLLWGGFSSYLAQTTQRGYQLALPGYRYSFPRDHAAHPAYKTEWWYYTGHLRTSAGKTYGYELTFFRNGTEKGKQPLQSKWALTEVYPAHFAISDENQKSFFYTEKLNRAGLGLAGARDDIYAVWNETWFGELLGNQHLLRANAPNQAIHLLLTPEKPPVIHGRNGVSQKANCFGCASHYYSMTRLRTQGVLYINNQAFPVTGISWMDHEFGSNQLAPSQVGWDWFSIQLSNNTELMLYLLRNRDGSLDPNSSGTIIFAKGDSRHLSKGEFQVKSTGSWVSPKTKTKYPMGWQINIPGQQMNLTLKPTFEDQELITQTSTGVTYWEGSNRVSGTLRGKPIEGQAYVEMTGYSQAFRAKI